MKKRMIALLLAVATMTVFAGCGVVSEEVKQETITFNTRERVIVENVIVENVITETQISE